MTSAAIGFRRACLVAVLCLGAVCVGAQQRVPAPRDPMYQQYAEGLLARTVHSSEIGDGLRVELWDLLVGPGRRTAPFRLPGGAVLEIRGGGGNAVVSGKEQRVRTGSAVRADDGSQIVLVNSDAESPLTVRAIVIAAR